MLLPIFAKVYLSVGSAWLGWLWSALGAGMVLVTSALAGVKNKSAHASLSMMAGGTGVAAVSVLGLSFVPGPWSALPLVAVVGAGTAIFTPLLWTLLQEYTPGSLRGRVFTLVGTTDMAASTLAIASMGFVADRFGPSFSLRAIGVLFLGTALTIGLTSRPRQPTVDEGDMASAG